VAEIKNGKLGLYDAEHTKCNQMMTVGFKELTRNIRTEALYLMSIYGHLQGGPKWHHFYTELRLNFRYTTCEMYTFH